METMQQANGPEGTEYKGYMIWPTSYQDVDMPGHFFPTAQVTHPMKGDAQVALQPVRGIDLAEANAMSLAEAKRRIRDDCL